MAFTNKSCVLLAVLLCFTQFLTYVASEEEDTSAPVQCEFYKACAKELGVEGKDPKESGVSMEKMMACTLEKRGVIDGDGQLSYEKATEGIKERIKDEKALEQADEIIKECEKQVGSVEGKQERTDIAVECFKKIFALAHKGQHAKN